MPDCLICFERVGNKSYKCDSCNESMCFSCISEYIKYSATMSCICKQMIFPSKLPKNLPNIEIYKTAILKSIELGDFEIISNAKDIIDTIKKIRKERFEKLTSFPVCIKYAVDNCFDIEFVKIVKTFKKESAKIRDFTKVCSQSWCNGTISSSEDVKSLNLVCDKCNTHHCKECKEIALDDHKCNSDILESIKVIETAFHNCPNCKLPIQKSSGCSYLTCAACNTKFDHNTNKVNTSHGGHSIPVQIKERENVSTKLIERISKENFKTLLKIENFKIPDKELVIKAYIKGNSDKTIFYYEKFILENEQFKKYQSLIQEFGKLESEDNIDKIEEILESV